MKILVVGDACTDEYAYGDCARLCPEGPVPILSEIEVIETLGMAANTHQNMLAFCPNAKLISNNPMEIIKTRFVEKKTNQLLLRVDTNDTTERISKQDIDEIYDNQYDLIVVSDYCKGFLHDEDLVNIGRSSEHTSVLDSKRPFSQKVIDSFDFVKLNESEYNKNKEILNRPYNKEKVVVTMGGEGVRFLDKKYRPEKTLQTFDVSGAGDVFTAVFSYSIVSGLSISDSIVAAQNCCIKVIQRRGTCVYNGGME
jgi:bifunctional ADP-heptose synthase (sugar kinase/adenylyltransferase)